jgi:hypothetical protein
MTYDLWGRYALCGRFLRLPAIWPFRSYDFEAFAQQQFVFVCPGPSPLSQWLLRCAHMVRLMPKSATGASWHYNYNECIRSVLLVAHPFIPLWPF